MGENVKQFYNPIDDCIYFYDKKRKCYRKICDIGSFSELPPVIKNQIKALIEEAKQDIMLPID